MGPNAGYHETRRWGNLCLVDPPYRGITGAPAAGQSRGQTESHEMPVHQTCAESKEEWWSGSDGGGEWVGLPLSLSCVDNWI